MDIAFRVLRILFFIGVGLISEHYVQKMYYRNKYK